MEGGLTFFPQPWVCGWVAGSSWESGAGADVGFGSTRAGGAKTTAVLEIVGMAAEVDAVEIAVATAAPTGNRGAAGLAFCAVLRRTGAKARLADHPGGHRHIAAGRRDKKHGR